MPLVIALTEAMSGTKKMEKFELDAYVREQLEPAVTPSGRTVVAPVAEPPNEEPSSAGPTSEESSSGQPAAEAAASAEAPSADAVGADAELEAPRSHSHPPARPPMSSGPSLKEVQEEPSIIVAKPAPADPAALRTRLAKKFVSLADDVNDEFKEFTIGAGAWGVELTAPQGMSTGGGKQAIEHLRLRPKRPGYGVLLGGQVNPVDNVAELRDYAHMCMLHEIRFRKRLEITENEWEQFLRKVEVVLRGAEFRCERVGPTKELIAQRTGMHRINRIATVVFVVVMALAAFVLFRIATT